MNTAWRGKWRCTECGHIEPHPGKHRVVGFPWEYCNGKMMPYDRRSPDPALAGLIEAAQDTLDAHWDMSPLEYAKSRGLPFMSDKEGEAIVARLRAALEAARKGRALADNAKLRTEVADLRSCVAGTLAKQEELRAEVERLTDLLAIRNDFADEQQRQVVVEIKRAKAAEAREAALVACLREVGSWVKSRAFVGCSCASCIHGLTLSARIDALLTAQPRQEESRG